MLVRARQRRRGKATPTAKSGMKLCCIYGTRAVSAETTASVARLLAQLVAGLAHARPDWQFQVVAPSGGHVEGAVYQVPTLNPALRLSLRVGKRLCGWRESDLWARKAVQALDDGRETPDVFLCCTGALPVLLRARFPQSKIIYWIHSLPGREAVQAALDAVSASDALVLPTRALYDCLWQRFEADCFPTPVWLFRNWVDPDLFAPVSTARRAALRQEFAVPADALALVHVGGWAPNKGLRVLLHALRASPPPTGRRVVLLTAAGTSIRRRQALAAGVDLVELERLSPARMNELYNAADVGVVPSVWFENAPLSVLEMMAAERPVLAAQAGGIPELVEATQTGWLVSMPNDVAGWAQALQRVYAASAGDLERMGKAGRQRVLSLFTPAIAVEQWTALLEQLVASPQT